MLNDRIKRIEEMLEEIDEMDSYLRTPDLDIMYEVLEEEMIHLKARRAAINARKKAQRGVLAR